MSRLREKCGVVGIWDPDAEAARLSYFALSALQHRGQEGSGIVASNGNELRHHIREGLVAQVYDEASLKHLAGDMAVGHNRYATSGGGDTSHTQPVLRSDGVLALAHNGNIPDTTALEQFLRSKKIFKHESNDSEMMADAIRFYHYQGYDIPKAIKSAWPLFTGTFACTLLTTEGLFAFRDQHGVKPLCLGKLPSGGYVVASETCALDIIGGKYIRDIEPGELISVGPSGIKSFKLANPKPRLEVFEYVYFARHDSVLLGQSVNTVRRRLGAQLALESNVQADLVVPIPDSAIPAALGYAEANGLPFDLALVKNRYIHRTFIQPTQALRERAVQMKLNPIQEALEGKDVILIDDSIVRGTTIRQIIRMLRKCKVGKVHVRISAPPVRYPDFYGVDTPDQKELIASQKTLDQIREEIGADSLQFLSYEGLLKAINVPEDQLCTACFSGDYPVDLGSRAIEVNKLEPWDQNPVKQRLKIPL